MENRKYTLRYLPLFYDDLKGKVMYIAEVLHNPDAANKLLDSVESAIIERLPIAEAFEPFHSVKERRYPYYRIYVDNFVIYYVVIAEGDETKIMEVRRLLYKRQDRDTII